MGLVVICKEIGQLRMAITGCPIQQSLVLQLIAAPHPQDPIVPLGIALGKAGSE